MTLDEKDMQRMGKVQETRVSFVRRDDANEVLRRGSVVSDCYRCSVSLRSCVRNLEVPNACEANADFIHRPLVNSWESVFP
jgi:hypothetical protein